MTTFESRATLGLRAPRSASRIPGPVDSSTVHYNGPKVGIPKSASHSRCRAFWLGVQRFHMDEREWADIAYSVGVCNHGVVMAGRGKGVRTAANGTNHGNNTSYAIMVLVGEGEVPSEEAKRAIKDAAAALGAPRLKVHSDHKATACPGNTLRNWVRTGAGTTPVPDPTPTPPKDDEVTIKPGAQGPAVALLQRCLINEELAQGNAHPLPLHGANGDFNKETHEALLNYQRAAFKRNPDLVTGEFDGITVALLLRYEHAR